MIDIRSVWLSYPVTGGEQLHTLTVSFHYLKCWKRCKKGLQASLCFYGPPGTGKTQLAEYLAE
jgi:AAA+ superfamily predicted ATPase